ncbi:hypothetical protein KZX37_07735 [Microbacterium sp. EYE_5]|uniref:hypothetical protein n=1 Tax=unclassified Microbacterium TaxID=2609290 RepID=UPI00200683E8|nr:MULTISPECIES: hypothetical protein [unclassified Microbacterium]MCK6081598.1 hypothetical protein [Microbacterium sp. EYE_382]MCK6086868.1 hypothetical protein [Microbacterium sp. EYE_384]MCK6123634.1 hypothetical protein [Microbacterium sp. EYE_80]MCK6126543.1 hypothetical protein [Microbacterium sp. EYE_79]MCK6142552.1 hypothetical protein [Microbacterium sp. EYE_39]
MRADTDGTAVGGSNRLAAAGPGVAGRTEVAERVLVGIARAVSADVIGVPRGEVSVGVADRRDGMALRVSSPLPVPDLDDSAAVRTAVPVLERAAQMQEQLRERLTHLLGRDIVRVDITVTGARMPERRRVR